MVDFYLPTRFDKEPSLVGLFLFTQNSLICPKKNDKEELCKMLKISVISLPVIWEVNYANRKTEQEKRSSIWRTLKRLLIAKQKIINKFR